MTASTPERPLRDPLAWHLLLLLVVSAVYESQQLHHGIALFDEGWPAYAVMRLRAGGVLYDDVFFPFPPGHLLPAWIASALDPPGVLLSRLIYSAFNTLACLGLYLVGRRVMSPYFALLGALLLAVAAPRSHWWHLLFGYRYVIFGMLALLCFERRLRGGDLRWAAAAGFWAGIALAFRITPAFSVSCAVAVAIVAAQRDPRRWLRDGGAYALGLALAVALPLAWIASGAGLGALWDQAVAHILVLQGAQSRSLPELALPAWGDRKAIHQAFVALQLRLYPALYAGYLLVLGVRWLRARRRGRGFADAFLLAVVSWGAISLLRALGRTDEYHLDSALPPACLLLAHAASGVARALRLRAPASGWPRRATRAGLLCVALGAWMGLLGVDHQLTPERRGSARLTSLRERVYVRDAREARNLDATLAAIRSWTRPEDVILDLSASPYLYVLSGRPGPGGIDIVMPGSFRSEAEEQALVARLAARPPAAVIWPRRAFDSMKSRSLRSTAPRVREWVMQRYRAATSGHKFAVLLPLGSPQLPDAAPALDDAEAS